MSLCMGSITRCFVCLTLLEEESEVGGLVVVVVEEWDGLAEGGESLQMSIDDLRYRVGGFLERRRRWQKKTRSSSSSCCKADAGWCGLEACMKELWTREAKPKWGHCKVLPRPFCICLEYRVTGNMSWQSQSVCNRRAKCCRLFVVDKQVESGWEMLQHPPRQGTIMMRGRNGIKGEWERRVWH